MSRSLTGAYYRVAIQRTADVQNKRFPSHRLDQFQLRLPAGMRDAIAKKAAENKRSMTAEIVARLEQTTGAAWRPHNQVEQPATTPYDGERRLLTAFRQLSDEQKNALLVLLGA